MTQSTRKTVEQKNAEARAELEPLEPGERPLAVTIGALVAAALAISNFVAYAVGAKPDEVDSGQAAVYLALVTAILVACAIGMWQVKYWAVLGFQTLLALQVLVSALALLTANSFAGVIVWLALLAGGGLLFWFMIRAMARIQMPQAPESQALRDARAKLAAERERAGESNGTASDG